MRLFQALQKESRRSPDLWSGFFTEFKEGDNPWGIT
jgi:hypothetical protein